MRIRFESLHRPRRQRGAALLTAMIIVTLVATLAAAMVWQQWRAVQVESAERARAQAAWILSGALDYALLILKETAPAGRATTLTDLWATPLAESRLSTFLAIDKTNADDGPEAFLSGDIVDAQSRYNLSNLVVLAQGNVPAHPAEAEVETLVRLCQTVGVDSGVANRIADGMVKASVPAPTADAPLMPETVDQLTWFGVDAASVQALRPYVAVLQPGTALNVNTAPKEVLAAVVGGDAEGLARFRQRTPFQSPEVFRAQAGMPSGSGPKITTASSNFEVRARLRLADRVLVERSLVQRQANSLFALVHSERVAGVDQVGK